MKSLFGRRHLAFTACACLLASCSEKNTSPQEAAETTEGSAEEPQSTASSPAPKYKLPKDGPLSFNEHVQPILSASCYHCHGPDSGTRRPDASPLRLDTPEGAFAKRENGKAVIIPGDPDNSLLIQLMETKNLDEIMPPHPAKDPHGKIMPAEEVAIIRRWVKEGANYEKHWAFIPPKSPAIPEINLKDWARNPIDHFVANKLEDAGLKPNDDAEKSHLLRRLTLDLTGLPPTVEELAAFMNDSRDFDKVYAEKVDQLLSSDAYAEHFARHWLDVARYADTHGIHIDNFRDIWPYRDWVIRAFRSNMPFDQFTREQIAGDMFPNATIDQKIASGFHRCLPTTGEGGAINEEYDAIYAQDRVSTTAAAWLGLTVGCAACHDHKFDPISTKENYQLAAFFRNTTMEAMDKNQSSHPPHIRVPAPQDRARFETISHEIQQVKTQLDNYKQNQEAAFTKWLDSYKSTPNLKVAATPPLISLPLTEKAKGLTDVAGKSYPSDRPIEWVTGPYGDAALFTNNNAVNLGNLGDFERNQPFSYGAWLKAPNNITGAAIAKMDAANSHRGYDLWFNEGHLAVHIINQWPDNAIKVRSKAPFPADQWFHALVTYDGSSQAGGIKLYINGIATEMMVETNKLNDTIKNAAPFLLGKRHNDSAFNNGQMQNFNLYNSALTPDQALSLSLEGKLMTLRQDANNDPANQQHTQQLRDYYFYHIDKGYEPLRQKFTQLTAESNAMNQRGTITLVMQEKTNEQPFAHVLDRGVYSEKREKVFPEVPAVLNPMTKEMPKNRLGLAMWLTDPANPLPARVTVNRYWQYFFGNGIVETSSDFGVMGARPSNPHLLDWLATDFVANKWDFHHLIRTIVTSSTYRQANIISPEKLEKDPLNILLSRGPRYRLDAEQIRDLALASSGLLVQKVGGPPVRPYQPEGIWESVAMKQSDTRSYKQDTGENLYRRSLYTLWKRTAPPAAMEILNAPAREVSCTRRELTNTPLQAFVMMNDPQFVESSRVLATHAIQQAKSTQERIDFIARRLISRECSAAEREAIERTLTYASEKFTKQPEDAKKLIAVGESKAPAELNPTELAAWTLIASQILNMDETVNK